MASERKAEEISSPETELWRSIGPVTELSKKSCRLLYSSLGYDSDLCLFHVQGEFFSMDTRCAHAGMDKTAVEWDLFLEYQGTIEESLKKPLLNLSHVGCFEGGPLCEGDVEEADGVLKVFCPWHDYDFDIRTGESQTGLQSQSEDLCIDQGWKQDSYCIAVSPIPGFTTSLIGHSVQQQVYEVKVEDGLVYVKHRSQLSLTPLSRSCKGMNQERNGSDENTKQQPKPFKSSKNRIASRQHWCIHF